MTPSQSIPCERYRQYDPFAWFYRRYWAKHSLAWLPAIEQLLLQTLRPGSRILDLCCGTGDVAAILSGRGYEILGVDGSEAMLAFAREAAPAAQFRCEDIRTLSLDGCCDAALSLFDSLNHIMFLEDLEQVFANVHDALVPGGTFLFDLNLEQAYLGQWANHCSWIDAEDHMVATRSSYAPADRVVRFEFTLFREDQGWHRDRLRILERPYSPEEILDTLHRQGFVGTRVLDAPRDLQLSDEVGRAFFLTSKESAEASRCGLDAEERT